MKSRKPRTREEWLDWYASHGGSKDLELHPDETVYFHEEHGLVSWLMHDDVLEVHHMAGDGRYWAEVLKAVMKHLGLKTLRAYTRRNPKAWARKYGGHIRGYYMECGLEEMKG